MTGIELPEMRLDEDKLKEKKVEAEKTLE